MKQFLILILFSLISLVGFSQNGGQFFENNIIRVEYVGYLNGNHTFKVHNKQNCEARIRTKADQDPAVDVQVPALSHIIVLVARPTPAGILFRAKAETACISNPDMGWLEINTALITLNLIENFPNLTKITREGLTVSLKGAMLESSFGIARYRKHIIIYDLAGKIIFNQHFEAKGIDQTDLRRYLVRGLNIIQVLIERPAPIQFVFKCVQ